jgi:nitronate monooxygenase
MAGGPSTPELVAAVSNAGGLGSLGAGYMAPDAIRSAIRRIRQLTDKPFAVNLFVPEPNTPIDTQTVEDMKRYLASVQPWGEEVAEEIRRIQAEHCRGEDFARQLQVIMEERVPVFSFTFGCPDADTLAACKARGIRVIGTATTVAEAIALEKAGVDAVVAQGYEAGGHRGSFLADGEAALIGTLALVPQVVDHVSIPVIASGGVMDGRGIAACLALGAAAVQMGTAFLAAEESGAHPAYKTAVLATRTPADVPSDDADTAAATARATVLTRAFSGKPARGLRNAFIEALQRAGIPIPPYPVQNTLTRPIRNWAARHNNAEYMSLWAGQAAPLSRPGRAGDLVRQLVDETEQVLQSLR